MKTKLQISLSSFLLTLFLTVLTGFGNSNTVESENNETIKEIAKPENGVTITDLAPKAENGDVEAQNNLGTCYAKGEGVPKDSAEAVKWFRKVAEQGFAEAQYNLGICYDEGKGVSKDSAEAVKWYRKAAEQGNEKAIKSLRELDK
jgi:TPR repeat protein